jgi:hypothetical protein
VFFLFTLPFRIFFGLIAALLFLPFALLFLPFLLLRFFIKATIFAIVFPVLLVVGFVTMIAVGGAMVLVLMVPLLPFAFLAACVWAIARLSHRSVVPV